MRLCTDREVGQSNLLTKVGLQSNFLPRQKLFPLARTLQSDVA
jgi:hypothetical protein